MANRIVGLDIGTWAIKAVAIEPGGDIEVVDYREIEYGDGTTGAGTGGADGSIGDPSDELSDQESDELFPGDYQETDQSGDNEAGDEASDDDLWSDEGIDPDEEGPSDWAEEPATEAVFDEEMGSWAAAVARLVEQGFFEGVNRVVTSFPNNEAATLHLNVPFEREDDVEEVLPHLLMDELPMSFEDIVYDFVVVPGRTPDQWEALLGFVQRQQMREFLDTTQQSGVDPAVVGVPELMLRYAGDKTAGYGVDHYGVIDVGHRFTRLLIMSEGKPVVAHTTRRGGANITEALAENFQISTKEARTLKHQEGVVGNEGSGGDRRARKIQGTIEEALRPIVRDMRRTFQSAYAKYGVEVDEIYLCGGTSRLRGLKGYLEGEFEVQVDDLGLEEELVWQGGPGERDEHPELTLATASALQEPLDSKQEKLIDLRQDEFVYRGKSSYLRRQLVRLGAIAGVLAVMLAGVLVMQYYDQKSQLEAMERAVAEQTDELFGESVTDPADVQARLEGEGAANRAFIPQMSAYEQMVRVVDEMSEDIPLELDRIEVDTDRSLIRMMGETDSPQAVDALAGDIERLDCLQDVSKEQVDVQADDRVQFELQIASACS